MIYGKMPVLFLSAVFSEKNGSINNTVAHYILEHQELVKEMGITELAEACHVSTSSISRFCKEIGLDNFAELRELVQNNQMVFEHNPSPSGTQQVIHSTVQKITDSIHLGGENMWTLEKLLSAVPRNPPLSKNRRLRPAKSRNGGNQPAMRSAYAGKTNLHPGFLSPTNGIHTIRHPGRL